MGRIPGFVALVGALAGAVAALEAHQEILLEAELLAGVIGGGVDARVHADGVAGARLDAEAAEHAAQLVDDEARREALVAAPFVARRVLAGLDVDALRRARRRAAEARHAARRAVVA